MYTVHVHIYGVDGSKPFPVAHAMERELIGEMCEHFPMVGKYSTIHHFPRESAVLGDVPADYVAGNGDVTIALRITETENHLLVWGVPRGEVDVEKLKNHMSAFIDSVLVRHKQ